MLFFLLFFYSLTLEKYFFSYRNLMLMRAKLRLKMFFCVYVDQNAKTLLIKNLPDKVIQHELKEVFEDGFQIRLVSKDGMSKRYVLYLELEKNMCLLDLNKQNFIIFSQITYA